MKFRPCIDLHDGKVKQIVGGTLTASSEGLVENFVADRDSAYYADMFMHDGLTGGHVIMLGPSNREAALRAIRAYPQGLQVGGGITPENASLFLENGASHVIVTSYIFEDGEINMGKLDSLLSETGRDRLVLDLSCRSKDGVYYVVTDRWQKFSSLQVNAKNLSELAACCDEFLIHGVDVEGKRMGIQEDLVQNLGEWITIPSTYAGGIRSIDDLELVNRLGKGRLDATVGSALDLFGGSLPYGEVLAWQAKFL